MSAVRKGRKNKADAIRKDLVQKIYEARRDRAVNPEGTFDRGGRWYPSDRENSDGYTRTIRGPSRAWPYSYLVAARTRMHVIQLVDYALDGEDVPADVSAVVTAAVRVDHWLAFISDQSGLDLPQYAARDWAIENGFNLAADQLKEVQV